MKQIFLLLFLSLSFTSCYTSQGLASRIVSKPVVLTKTLLTGLYENQIPDDPENSLWNDLCLHNSRKVHDTREGNQVFIEYTEEKEIKVELYQNNQLLDSMLLPGKPKDNYFVIRKGSHFFTLILITSKVSKKTILGNDANADLLLAQGRSSNTMFLESEVGDEGETITATYMRLGDTRPNYILQIMK
jgi:sensor c-di-GMP phosphodiesterase-like protein